MALKQDRIHTFSIDHDSEEDNCNYRGQFTSKKLAMMDISKISTRKSQLNGGMYTVKDENGKPTGAGIPEETDFLNYMIAYLEVALVQTPDWFNLGEISDQGVVLKVFEEATKFENSFRAKKRAEDEGHVSGSEGNGQGTSKASDDGIVPKKVVGREVSSALDA